MKPVDRYAMEKAEFNTSLSCFSETLAKIITSNGDWNIKGFIDTHKNIYTISTDTKVLSKILELHLFPSFLEFARQINYTIELATHQNWYPDLTFVNNMNSDIKFAVDLKTTYINEDKPAFCNGFTLGSHGIYFINRNSSKNIQYPYNEYAGHFCLGIIYSRVVADSDFEVRTYAIDDLPSIPSVIRDFTFFVAEKWRIASDKRGSGNTANIGSIKRVADILTGNGVFAKAGEEIFDNYWANYGKIQVKAKNGTSKLMTSFEEYIAYRGLPSEILNK